jgi:ribosomal protein L20A (L18A)
MSEWTRDTPWRQGQLLPSEVVEPLKKSSCIPEELIGVANPLVIVASHDCDIAQSEEKEPNIEVVFGRRIEVLDGNCTNAKAPRTLHIQFEGTPPLLAEFVARNKQSIQKTCLNSYSPNNQCVLSEKERNTFACWLAARYRRSAFPDKFEKLLKECKLDKAIVRAMKPTNNFIDKVLFDLEESSNTESVYVLGITLLYSSEPDFEKATKVAISAKEAIENVFSKLGKDSGLENSYVDIISDNALTYQQFTALKPWRLDYISLGSEPQQPVD